MPEEITLELPWDIIDSGKGIAIDIGGSVIKFIYLHRDDWVEPPNRSKGTKGQLRLVNFAREEIDDGFRYLNQNIFIIRDSPNETVKIFTTGLGGSQFQARIQSELNVKNINVSETDCFVHSFNYLMKNLHRKDFLFDTCQPAYEEATETVSKQSQVVEQLKEMTAGVKDVKCKDIVIAAPDLSLHPERPFSEQPGIYPAGLYFCGSGFGGLRMEEDGSFTILDGSGRGGRSCYALGCLLTGAKTFEEFLGLCERGNASNVGTPEALYIEGLIKTKEGSNISYFDQAVGKTVENFQKEDLARHILEMFLGDLVQIAYYTCISAKVKTLFFAGGFVNNPLVRQLLTREWLNKNISMQTFAPFTTYEIGIYFMKPGAFLGALGAYLNSKLQFLSYSGKTVTESKTETAPPVE